VSNKYLEGIAIRFFPEAFQSACSTSKKNEAQGCQMVCFQTKNPNLGKFWWVMLCKIFGIFRNYLLYFTAIGNILCPFGIFCGNLVLFPRFGILDQEKSGNPDYAH
jgi:hypothetical protein